MHGLACAQHAHRLLIRRVHATAQRTEYIHSDVLITSSPPLEPKAWPASASASGAWAGLLPCWLPPALPWAALLCAVAPGPRLGTSSALSCRPSRSEPAGLPVSRLLLPALTLLSRSCALSLPCLPPPSRRFG